MKDVKTAQIGKNFYFPKTDNFEITDPSGLVIKKDSRDPIVKHLDSLSGWLGLKGFFELEKINNAEIVEDQFDKEARQKAIEVKKRLDNFIENEINRPPTPTEFQGITYGLNEIGKEEVQ